MSVYFLQDGPRGPIKIGYSAKSARRTRELDTKWHRQLTPLGVIQGAGKPVERAFHLAFRKHRIRGEWFAPNDALYVFISIIGLEPNLGIGELPIDVLPKDLSPEIYVINQKLRAFGVAEIGMDLFRAHALDYKHLLVGKVVGRY